MSCSNSGSFSCSTTAAVVCFEKAETQPCEIRERRTTAATWSVTSRNSRAAVVRTASVSAQRVRPPIRRTRAPGWSSASSSRRKAGLDALPIPAQLLLARHTCAVALHFRCCAGNVAAAVTNGRGVLPSRRADLVETVAAVDRPAHGGSKWHLGGLAAFGTNHFVELLGAAGAPNVPVDRAAVGTAGRLVLKALGGIELLLTDGEDEVETAITARQSLVAEAHGESPFVCLWISETRRSDLAFDPTFPGAIIASAKQLLVMTKR